MYYRYTLSVLFLLLHGALLQAQNCPTSVAGQLLNTNTTLLASDTTPAPVYAVVPAGLPNTEFLVVRQDSLAADGFGPPILISSLNGRVVPNDLGLSTCQELCIVPFSYNLNQIQLVVDSLLNGMYANGATCCASASSFFPGLCDSLNAQGISAGTDIQSLNDVIAFTNALAGMGNSQTSVPNLISTIGQLNSFIGLFGNCAANVAEICYQVDTSDMARACYQVVLPNAATQIIASPDTIATMNNSTYQCTSTYLPNAATENIVWSIGIPDLGCTIDNMGLLTTDTTDGQIWVYSTGTRGCQEDSILVEISRSVAVSFLANSSLEVQANPMPFDGQLVLNLEVQAGDYQLELVDFAGQVLLHTTRSFSAGAQQWVLSTKTLPAGVYVLQISGATERGSLLVLKQ